MKQKVRRISRSTLSVILTLCMIMSCFTVGLVATDAAKVQSDSVGDNNYTPTGYWWGTSDSSGHTWASVGTESSGTYTGTFTLASKSDYYFYLVGPDSSGYSNKYIWTSDPVIDRSAASSVITGSNSGERDGAHYAKIYCNTAGTTVNISYTPSTRTFSVSLPAVTLTLDASGIASESSSATMVGGTSSASVTASSGTSSGSYQIGETVTVTVDPLSDTTKKPTARLGNTNVPLTFNGTNYTGSFTVPSSASTLYVESAAKSSYSVVTNNTDGLGTVYPSTAQTYTEDSPVTLTAVPTGNNYFKKWQGTAYSSSDNPATYYVNAADADNNGTITITGSFGTNHYEASAGASLAPANIYAGINATFFDYYYDNEVTNGWLHFSGENNDINPYKTFNTALSEYAKGNGVNIPLYFGNFYWPSDNNDSAFSAGNGNFLNYTNWFGPPNNIDRLRRDTSHYSSAVGGVTDAATHYAITGLTGTQLSSDHNTIYHFDKDAANNTGVPMALFDEEWLTHRDKYTDGGVEKDYSYKGALATIIDSPFPVVVETRGGTTTYPNKIYVSAGDFGVESANGKLWAHFSDGGDGDPQMTYDSTTGYYSCDIPTGATQVTFVRTNGSATGIEWEGDSNYWNKSNTCSVPTSTTSDQRLYTFEKWDGKDNSNPQKDMGKFNVGAIASSYGTTSGGYKYYGFNSTGATDNAYFEGLNGGSPTNLTMEYGAGTTYGVHDNQKSGDNFTKYGCFPFDGNIKNTNTQAKDYGFGVRMDIPFTLGQDGKINGNNQIFEFSGDDDLWVFIDGELVLDLGGAHGVTTGSIDFGYGTDQAKITVEKSVANKQYPTGDITPVERNHTTSSGVFSFTNTGDDVEITKHTMTIYYMERGMGESNLKFGFSFTPISNEFMTEKKLGTDSVNSALKSAVETAVANDQFNFTNQWSATTTNADFSNLAYGKKYTLIQNGTKSNETTEDNSGILPHQNEWFSFGDQTEFIGQFTVGQYFKLNEAAKDGNSAYTYTPSLEVKDVVTGSTISADNGAYLFKTTKAATDPTHYDSDTDPTRIKATYTNSIATQNVTITKAIADTTAGTPGDFTVCVRVKLPGESSYTAYALPYSTASSLGTLTVTGTGASATATATIHNGETITIQGIPVGSSVEVTETGDDGTYTYHGASVTGSATDIANADNSANGKKFTLTSGNTPAAVTINNSNTPQTRSFKITKAAEELAHTVVTDHSTNFLIKVEYFDTANTQWVNLADSVNSLTGKNYNNQEVSRYKVEEGGVNYYPFHFGDVLDVTGVPDGTQYKVTEYNDTTIPYSFYSATATGTTQTETTARGVKFTVNADGIEATVKNKPKEQTLIVTKATDFDYDDGSTFVVTIKYKTPNQYPDSYLYATWGKAYPTGTETDAEAVDPVIEYDSSNPPLVKSCKYTIRKNGHIKVENLPEGSRVEVEEIASETGHSNTTHAQRFTFKELTLQSTDTIEKAGINGGNFLLLGDLNEGSRTDTTHVTLTNRVMKNKVTITKRLSTGTDTTTVHYVSVKIWINGDPSITTRSNRELSVPNHEIKYVSRNETPGTGYDSSDPSSDPDKYRTQCEPTWDSTLNAYVIPIHQSETIALLGIPVGSFVEVKEVQPGTNYNLSTMSVENYAECPAGCTDNVPHVPTNSYDSTTGTLTFQTRDAVAEVSITNALAKKTVTIKKVIDGASETTTPFTVNVKTSTNGTDYANATGAYTSSLGTSSNGSFTDGNVTIHNGEEISFTVNVNTYVKVTEVTAGMSWKYKFSKILVGSTEYTNENCKVQVTDATMVEVHNAINVKYVVTYRYMPYQLLKEEAAATQPGKQWYVKRGTFTGDQLENLLTWDSTTGNLGFKTTELRKNFLNGMAPYEDNFMTDITWNSIVQGETGEVNTTYSTDTSTTGEIILNVTMDAIESKDRTVYVYFKFPYEVDSTLTADDGVAYITDGDLYKYAERSTKYAKWVTYDGTDDNSTQEKFVTAPEYVMQGGTKLYFHHWQVTSRADNKIGTVTRNAGKVEQNFKKCYFRKFNLTIYQDCTVIPVFMASDDPFNANALSAYDSSGGEAYISFLENSRNQWNENGATTTRNTGNDNRKVAGDRIYTDFLLTFGHEDKVLKTGNNYEIGFVLEKVALIGDTTKTSAEYKTLYGSGINDVTAYINGQTATGNYLSKTNLTLTELDNKNQMKYMFSIPARADGSLEDTVDYKDYVLRAYCYVKKKDGSMLKVSAPEYFTIKDMASIQDGQNGG